jgi:3-oxoacyl-[acyl-carrier-protein] synthase-3
MSIIGRELSTSGSKIVGVVSCLPNSQIHNKYFVRQYGEESTTEVTRVIGVQSRYWATNAVSTRSLCVAASKKLIQGLHWDPNSIDAIIFVSQTPSYKIPATSCAIQNELGLSHSTFCLDVNYGCSGYTYGLWLANSLIANGSFKRVLLLVGDTLSQFVDKEDRATALLFGDAGTATAIEAEAIECSSEYKYILGTDGSGELDLLISNSSPYEKDGDEYLRMNGLNVLNFTFNRVPPLVKKIYEYPGFDAESIDFFLFHQANKFLIDHLTKKLKIDPKKVLSNIEQYGNTSGASIPLLLTTRLREQLLNQDLKLVLLGFGVGFSWALCAAKFRRLEYIDTIYL